MSFFEAAKPPRAIFGHARGQIFEKVGFARLQSLFTLIISSLLNHNSTFGAASLGKLATASESVEELAAKAPPSL